MIYIPTVCLNLLSINLTTTDALEPASNGGFSALCGLLSSQGVSLASSVAPQIIPKFVRLQVGEFILREMVWDARQKHSKSFRIYEYFNAADASFPQNKSGSNASVVVKIKTEQMQNDSSVSVYGYFLNEKIIAVISTKETDKAVEIMGIAVETKDRHSGIGTKLIDYVKNKSTKPIVVETDSAAVLFYKKCGFDTEEKIVSKSNVSYSRYVCTLNYK